MEQSAKSELKVGATVLVALVVLIGGLYWLKGHQLDQGRYVQEVWFPSVGTLSVGDPVAISGVVKGKVESVNLHDRGVNVGLGLTDDVVLHSDAQFTIKNVGLMGERFVEVHTGYEPEPLPRGEMALGNYDTGLPEVMGWMGRIAEDVHGFVGDLRYMVETDSTLIRLGRTATNLERLSQQTSDMIARNQPGIDRTVAEFGEAAQSLRRTLETNEAVITRSFHRFDSTTMRLAAFTDRLDTLATTAHTIVAGFRTGEGTLPRLMNDDQLLRRWEQTSTEIDELVRDIRANPGKYLKVQVSLF